MLDAYPSFLTNVKRNILQSEIGLLPHETSLSCHLLKGDNLSPPPLLYSPSVSEIPHFGGFTIRYGHNTSGMTSPEERSARRRHLYLMTYNNHSR